MSESYRFYAEVKALYNTRLSSEQYGAYFSACTNEWVFRNGKRIAEHDIEDYITKVFYFKDVPDAMDWFGELIKKNSLKVVRHG